jgi:predicted nucleotidyltransferase
MLDIEKIKPNIKQLAEKYGLSLVVLFGSQATGKTHSQSDVDLAFLAKRPMNLMEVAKMQTEFSEELKIRDLEMVALNGAHPFLLKQVAQKSIVLYEEEKFLFAKFKIYAFKSFIEAKKLFELRKLSFDKFLQKV